MPYDENLVQRIREKLGEMPGLVEKKMLGAVGFMLHGNLACGVNKDALIVRVGPENDQAALARPHTRRFNIRGLSLLCHCRQNNPISLCGLEQ